MRATRRTLLAVAIGLLGLLTLYVRREGPQPMTRVAAGVGRQLAAHVAQLIPSRERAPKAQEIRTDDASGFLAGRVLHADGRPAQGAEVSAAGLSDEALAVTGTDGAFLIDVKGGEQRLTAQVGDEAGAMPSAVTVTPGKLVDGIIIRLAAAAFFAGNVVSDTGAPVAGAKVTASMALAGYTRSEIHQGAVVATTTTDERGHFKIGRLGRSVYTVQASARGFLPAKEHYLALEAGQHFPLSLQITRAGAIEGVVVDEAGAPVAQARVKVWDWQRPELEAQTEANGRYRIEEARPGDRISVTATRGDTAGAVRKTLDLVPGGIARADFALPSPGMLSGVARIAVGGPAAFATIDLAARGQYPPSSVTTDSAGRYRTSILPGVYDVTCRFRSAWAKDRATVRPGETTELNLTLADQKEEARPLITGLVLDVTGAPLAGAWVGTRGQETGGVTFFKNGLEGGSALTDAEGRFEVEPWRSADVVNIVARAGGRFGSVRGVKIGTDVVVQLQPAAAIVGHASGVSGAGLEVSFQPRDDAAPSESASWLRFAGDQFTLAEVPAGSSILRAREGGRAGSLELSLEPGEKREVDVRLYDEIPVTGRIVDRLTGNPIKDAEVMAATETYFKPVAQDGSFTLMLPSGSHTLEVLTWWYQPAKVPVVLSGIPLDLGEIPLERKPIGGVGLQLAQPESEIIIATVLAGGPAARAGLRAGDVLVKVDDQPVVDSSEATDHIRGIIGLPVTLTVRRAGVEMAVEMLRVDLAGLSAASP
jgi:protocatechuate 3,4-dioxygenase beta subunit